MVDDDAGAAGVVDEVMLGADGSAPPVVTTDGGGADASVDDAFLSGASIGTFPINPDVCSNRPAPDPDGADEVTTGTPVTSDGKLCCN